MLASLSKINWSFVFSFWIIFCFIVYVSILLPIIHYLAYCSFTPLAWVLFFKVVLVILGIFISIFILDSTVDLYKKACWDFDWVCIESIDEFGQNWHLDNIEFSNQWIWHRLYTFRSLISLIREYRSRTLLLHLYQCSSCFLVLVYVGKHTVAIY